MTEQKPCINGCGKPVKNQGVHDRYCSMKAKQEVPKEQKQPAQEQRKPINISDVQQFKAPDIYDAGQQVAWYIEGEHRVFRVPEFIGIMHTESVGSIPCALITTNEGTILPVFMIEGFIGVYPQNVEWPEPQQPHETTQPHEEVKPFEEPAEEKANEFTVKEAVQPIIVPKKKGFFGFLSKKKEVQDKTELESLIGEAINVGKA